MSTDYAPTEKVSVAVDEEYLSCFDDVVERCTCAGLEVEHVMEMLGIFTGRVDPEHVHELREIEGVSAVEVEHEYSVFPPLHVPRPLP